MKKTIIMVTFILCYVFSICSASSSVTPEECYIYNAGDIQLGRQTSIEATYPILGETLSFVQGEPVDAYVPMYAICEKGTIWIDDISGKATRRTVARIQRVIFTKEDVYTTKNIHIGDSVNKIYDEYGYPGTTKDNFLKPYEGIVEHWLMYFPIGGHLEHIVFGVKNGRVTAICISAMPGGL